MFLKKMTMLVVGAAALVALGVPAGAGAEWTDHNQPLASNVNAQGTGQLKYQGSAGSVECQMVFAAQLTQGTTTAHISSYEVDVTGTESVTDNCSVGGGTVALGCTDVEFVTTAGLPWIAHATSTQTIAVTTGTIQFHLEGGFFCPKTKQFTPGTMHITLTTQSTWSQGQLSGGLQADPSIGSSETMTASGTVSITPSGTYGVR
jgi:hypothetical protein